MDVGNLLVGVTITIAVLSLMVVVYVLTSIKRHRGVYGVALLFAMEFLYALSYALMLSVETLEAKMVFVHLEYTVIPFIAVTLLYVARKIIHRGDDERIGYYLPFLIIPLLTFTVVQFTHYTPIDWYYQDYALSYVPSFQLHVLVADKGWLYYVNTIHNVALVGYAAALFFRAGFRASGIRRRQQIVLGIFSLAGLIVAGMILLGQTTFPIDITLYLTSMLGVIFLVVLFRYEIFFLVPRAYRVIYEQSSDPILALDDQLKIIDWNEAAEKSELFRERSLKKYVPVDECLDFEDLSTAIRDCSKHTFKHRNSHYAIEPFRITGQSEWYMGYVVRIDDMTSYIQKIEQLDYQASHDTLTKALNRRALFKRVDQLMVNEKNQGEPYALMMIDLDDFKDVNDRHGHIIGDMLLEDLAHFIKTTVPDDTIVSRYGGEEFVVFMSGRDDKEAQSIAEHLREAIADETFVYDGHALSVKVSIGIACGIMGPSIDLVREIDAADKAMYASKDGGKNRVTTCNDD